MQVYNAPLRDMRFVLHELFAEDEFGPRLAGGGGGPGEVPLLVPRLGEARQELGQEPGQADVARQPHPLPGQVAGEAADGRDAHPDHRGRVAGDGVDERGAAAVDRERTGDLQRLAGGDVGGDLFLVDVC